MRYLVFTFRVAAANFFLTVLLVVQCCLQSSPPGFAVGRSGFSCGGFLKCWYPTTMGFRCNHLGMVLKSPAVEWEELPNLKWFSRQISEENKHDVYLFF